MKEIWLPVADFEAIYEVSNQGRVRRISTGRVLKPYPQHKGYLLIDLKHKGKRKTKALHRLVAETFISNPLGLPEVNHLGSKNDCRATMLEWRTEAGNNLHRMQSKNKGVSFYKRLNKWVARYSPCPGKEVWLGTFNTKAEAQTARATAVNALPYVL